MTFKFSKLYVFILLFFGIGTLANAQSALCKPLITKSTGETNCLANLIFEDIDNGSSDYDTYSLSQTEFSGPDTFTVTLTVSDMNGNSSSCESTLIVVDDVKPTPYVKTQVYVTLDMDNTKTLTPEMFDAGSFDNCSGISHMTITPSVVTCNDISPLQVEIRVYDNAGNWDYALTSVQLSNAQNSTQTLVCNAEIAVILSEGETKEIFTNMVLEGGPYKCWEEYDLDILENNVARADNFVSTNDFQKNLVVRVKDITTNNTCWATIIVTGQDCAVLNICDTKSRCSAEGDCNDGHSLSDDVEWPCDQVLVNVPAAIFNNPTPQALATFTSLDVNELQPFLYNGDVACNAVISKSYYDTYVNVGSGRLITRTWTVIHWASSQTYAYNQKISMNSSIIASCEICDLLAWNAPVTDCAGGHSESDAVEWPGDVFLTSKRFSPVDLSYEPGINPNDVKPVLNENCASYYSMTYSDVITEPFPDSLLVERTWTLLNNLSSELYSFVQKIYVQYPLSPGETKVCVRQLNGNTLNDVTLYPGNIIETGPCKEFVIDPANTLVKPSKESTDYLAGVDLADLIMLYEYILAIRDLEPSQILSGDFNGINGVSTLDIVLLTKMINGEQVNLSNWPSPWRFMVEELQPSIQNVRNQVILNFAGAPYTGHHFIGYKLGDINNSYLETNLQTVPVDVLDEVITAGEIYTTPVYSNDDIFTNGIQFKVYKTGKAKILNVKSSFFEEFKITEYDTYYSVIGFNQNYKSTNIAVHDIFLNITFQALQNSILSEALEWFDENHNKFILADTYEALPFEVTYENVISSDKNVDLNREITIYPNPANDKIFFKGLQEKSHLEVWDVSGQRVTDNTIQTGMMMDISVLIPGVYILKTQTQDGQTFVNRFVKI